MNSHDFLVVDVRDDDREGGHIPQSVHLPSHRFLADAIERLHKPYRHVPVLVFHCMYVLCACVRVRVNARGSDPPSTPYVLPTTPSTNYHRQSQIRGPSCARKYAQICSGDRTVDDDGDGKKVYILRGGFYEWQSLHRDKNPQLLEDFDRERWLSGAFDY